MTSDVQTQLDELEKQLTPLGAWEAIMYGMKTPEGQRFLETYAKMREITGDNVQRKPDGFYIDYDAKRPKGFKRDSNKT